MPVSFHSTRMHVGGVPDVHRLETLVGPVGGGPRVAGRGRWVTPSAHVPRLWLLLYFAAGVTHRPRPLDAAVVMPSETVTPHLEDQGGGGGLPGEVKEEPKAEDTSRVARPASLVRPSEQPRLVGPP